MQQVDHGNEDAKWNCTLSQPNTRYNFNVAGEGYIAGMPDVRVGYSKFPENEVESNPLDIINKK